MKNIQFEDLNKDELLTQTEPISIEYQGLLVGYYYPAIAHEKVKRVKEELDGIMENVLTETETGLTEEEPDAVETQVKLGHEFMDEYRETFQELAK